MSPALRCPSCGAPADDASQACASCDTPLPWHTGETFLAPQDPDKTRLSAAARPPSTPPRTRSSTGRAKTLSHSSGWAGTSSDIDFILLRAPLTTDISSWRAPAGFVSIGAVLLLGLAGCYFAARPPRGAERRT